jgi:hypothetical protein
VDEEHDGSSVGTAGVAVQAPHVQQPARPHLHMLSTFLHHHLLVRPLHLGTNKNLG